MFVSILLKPLLPISIPRIEMGPWALGLLGPGKKSYAFKKMGVRAIKISTKDSINIFLFIFFLSEFILIDWGLLR